MLPICYNDMKEKTNLENTLQTGASSEATETEVVDFQASIAELFAQMDVIDERIKRNQLETEQLRTETRVMLAQMQAA